MLASSSLLLSGRCTITEVAAHRDRVAGAVTSGDGALVFDLGGIEAADVTFVQLLVAARAEASRRGRAFSIAAWSSAATDTIARAGFHPADFAASAASGA